MLLLLGAQVQSLVGELGSHKPHIMAKKRKKEFSRISFALVLSPPSHIPSDLAFFSHVSFFPLLVLTEDIPSQDACLSAHDMGVPSLCHSISLSVSLLCFGSRNSYIFLSILCICNLAFFFFLFQL